MKKIAIPITEDNIIEDHFGRCKFYEIHTFSDTNEIVDVQLLDSDGKCGCKSNIVSVLVEEGVTFMLAGNIGDGAMSKLVLAGIGVIRGCSGNSADIILDFVDGKITDNGMVCVKHSKSHKEGLICNH
jgi:predicted Fe-Mo cluster-binding NifX family protein